MFSNLLPVRLRPAALSDLSSACDSSLLHFLSSHSELLIFFSILCRKSSFRLRSDLNPRRSLLLLLGFPDWSEFLEDLDFFSMFERSLMVLESLAPFRFPRLLCLDNFACLDNFPLRLVESDDIACDNFDAFIRRCKFESISGA